MVRIAPYRTGLKEDGIKTSSKTIHDVIVIGGGPAGLTAGMHLSRAGYATLLIEKDLPGGQARHIERIENYPGFPAGIGGKELMSLWISQARRWHLGFLRDEAVRLAQRRRGFRVVTSRGSALNSRAVVWCAGASFHNLGVPGEEKFRGRGVHHAAFEAAPQFQNQSVAVAGSGEAAAHQAVLLSRFADRVYLLGRGADVKAHRLLKERMADCANLVHVPHAAVERIDGTKAVERVLIRDTRNGRRRSLDVSGLFVLIGKKPSTPWRDPSRIPGFFAAGDASGDLCRQVVVAAGRGVEAAMKCIRYLEDWDDEHARA